MEQIEAALAVAFEHGITQNGDSPQRIIDKMVRALTGCHPDGRESREYHNWVWAFSDYGIRWETGKRAVARKNPHVALGYRANQPEYDEDGLVLPPEEEPPADDWRSHGTVGYDARMSETTGPSNMILRRGNVPAGSNVGPAKVSPDQLIGSSAVPRYAGDKHPVYRSSGGHISIGGGIEEKVTTRFDNESFGYGALNDITTGTAPRQLHQFSTIKCPWCSKDYDAIMASCGTGTTWSLFKCSHCNKLCASGRHIPTAVQIDPEILIIK